MKTTRTCGFVSLAVIAWATSAFSQPSLTIYNQDFAVVRDQIELSLKTGSNEIATTNITAKMEPDSVVLRDPSGKHSIRILEQNYRADPVSQELLLSLYEGQEIDFMTETGMVRGRVVRSGRALSPIAKEYTNRMLWDGEYPPLPAQEELPIIEANGRLRFGLPGEPLFPSLKDDTILKPTLHWVIETDRAGRFDAELCYITGGMSWEADYNLIYAETGDVMDLIGWITMKNETGKMFESAKIKLMAGDVNKIRQDGRYLSFSGGGFGGGGFGAQPVSEKTFDEYHLYTLNKRTTLRDRQTKQVEFVRAAKVKSSRFYVYNGCRLNPRQGLASERDSISPQYGISAFTKVHVMREFENSKQNNLGIPLPEGRIRFYRRDDDGQLEFTGENTIDHTPRDEEVRVFTGNAFDLVGERRQVDFNVDNSRRILDESFEIKVRNRKEDETVEIRVVEHFLRKSAWEITKASHEYTKTDSKTIEFRVQVKPGGEEIVTYSVHYSW